MGFFDLNIPYTESNKRNSTADKSIRLKLAVKAMEFGYTGVAYNRTIAGVMSESDRCPVSLFPLSSVLKVSRSISTAVNLHRRLLNVPTSTPFRQYTRLTVVVDSPAQGSALNSGNPVLKTYDIVAVRPLKQESFDQACKNYEVDIIAIDFSENRFRLKQPLIKAAIERGVFFEITYSGLIMDAQLRRQMISNAKLLVDWTRGKNLIFSSAAPSVTELRGPYDVANLASLLGISTERAKAAVSKTCRSLLANALRKKKFYKEAIRVELMSSGEQFNIEGAGFDDRLKWDPISSGEGDLQLDDMAKSFAASNKESKTVKAIDFVSIMDGLPSHGLHIKDIVSETKGMSDSCDRGRDLSAVTNSKKRDVPVDSKLHDLPEKNQTLVIETVDKGHLLNSGNRKMSPAIGTLEALVSVEGGESCAVNIEEEANIPNDSKVCFSCPEAEQKNLQAEVHKAMSETNVTNDGNESIHALENDTGIAYACRALPTAGVSTSFDDNHLPTLLSEEANGFFPGAPIRPPTVALNEVCIKFPEVHMSDTGDVAVSPVTSSLPISSVSLYADVPKREHVSETTKDVSVTPVDTLATFRSLDELHNNSVDPVVHEPLEDVSMEDQVKFVDHSGMNHLSAHASSSERVGRKRRISSGSPSFPFKRLLKPSHFNKVRKLKTKSPIA